MYEYFKLIKKVIAEMRKNKMRKRTVSPRWEFALSVIKTTWDFRNVNAPDWIRSSRVL